MMYVGGYLREPYPESIEKATTLLVNRTVTISHLGEIRTPKGGYLVLGQAPRLMTIDYKTLFIYPQECIKIVAMWIDQLPTNAKILHSWYNRNVEKWFADAGTYHLEKWEAEIEALTQDRRLIYDYRNERFFVP